MANKNVDMTLKDAVAEVLGMLTGLSLHHEPDQQRFHAVTRQLNRALRATALENEWSYYHSVESIGAAVIGMQSYDLRSTLRPRIIGDDAVRLVDATDTVRFWAYFLPRDALDHYDGRQGLRVAHTRSTLRFHRPLSAAEEGLDIQVPVMREPKMFELPEYTGEAVDPAVLRQTVDFDYPDYVILRAATYYAQADPVMQPRVQMLESQYKDMGYSLVERDTRNTDTPFQNEWTLPMEGDLFGTVHGLARERERVWDNSGW